ncbi:hypothetical protein CU097_003435 [Rhizopus azygosporus]|uniref:Uncharacterized protein n=1 Tax=Rhizopus azygosporus TaxID=86630 RepID=A0A367IQW9_RHIAZ|nr:hypothetical protein CU097_003435 [Rhizopus azygosporus]
MQKNYGNDGLTECFIGNSLEQVKAKINQELHFEKYNVPIERDEACFRMQKEIIEVEGFIKPIFKLLQRMVETFPMDDLGEKAKEDDLKS